MKHLRRLVEITKDAYNYKYNFESTLPNEVILFITSLCNFACETCFYSEKLNDTKNDLTLQKLVFNSNMYLSLFLKKLIIRFSQNFLIPLK